MDTDEETESVTSRHTFSIEGAVEPEAKRRDDIGVETEHRADRPLGSHDSVNRRRRG